MNRSMSLRSNSGGATLRRAWAIALLLIFAGRAVASDWDESVQVHGFASQGYVNTTDNRFFGDSEDGSFEFTELGLNASYRATPTVLVSAQLLSRRAGDMYDGSPSVDFALLDWTPINTEQASLGVMLGRVKNPLGLFNETRDVAFTRPSIFLPQQVYYDKVRNLVLSSDGVRFHGRRLTDLGTLEMDLGIGMATLDENVEIAFMGRDFAGELDNDGLAYVGHLGFESPDGAWRAALSGAWVDLDFERRGADPVGSGDVGMAYWIASLQYNAERWSLTAEYMEEPIGFDGFGPLLDGRDSTVRGYYLHGSYLLRNDLELVLRYGEGFADKDDKDGRANAAASGGLAPAHSFFQKDWMVGLRWDVTPSFMLRAEYQWNSGTWPLSPRENPIPNNTTRDWNMFSVLGSYRF